MMQSALSVWIMVISAALVCCSEKPFNNPKELVQTLLEPYDKRLRPNINQLQPTIVNVTFGILNIEDLDEVNSKFSFTGYMYITWMDEHIKWVPEDNHTTRSILFPVTEVWYPVIFLGFAHGKAGNPVDDWMTVRIYYSGHASLSLQEFFKSTCSVDLTNYPFDIQNCTIFLGAWGFLEDEVQLMSSNPYVDADYFIEHGEWEIIENYSVTGYPRKSAISVNFILRRRSSFYFVNIVLPIILMSFLNLLVFALPPESGERVSYSITVLLAMAVFLTIVSDNLPKTSKPVPLLSIFLFINFITSCLTCVLTIINLRIYYKNSNEPFPTCVQFILTQSPCSKSNKPSKWKIKTENHIEDSMPELNQADASSSYGLDEEQRPLTWADVSKVVDNVCMLFFLFITVTNSVGFMLIVYKQ